MTIPDLADATPPRGECPATWTRRCVDCGQPVPPGHVRCTACMTAASTVPASRYGPREATP